jgi:hypothetical protein
MGRIQSTCCRAHEAAGALSCLGPEVTAKRKDAAISFVVPATDGDVLTLLDEATNAREDHEATDEINP